MRLSKKIKCLKYLVYTYIVLISLCAAIQLAFGSFLLWSHRQHSAIINNIYWEPYGVLICLGLLTLCISYLGWSGTSKRKRCYLGLFSAFLVLLVIVQCLAGGWSFALRFQVTSLADPIMEKSFDDFLKTSTTDQTHIWNNMQKDLKCCGVGGSENYRKNKLLPWTCHDPTTQSIYKKGCLNALSESIEKSLAYCAIVSASTAFIECFGIFCVLQLMMLFKRPTINVLDTENQLRTRQKRELLPLSSNASSESTSTRNLQPHLKTKPVAPTLDLAAKT